MGGTGKLKKYTNCAPVICLPFPLALASFEMRWDLRWCCSHGDRYSLGLARNLRPAPFGVPGNKIVIKKCFL